MSVPSDRTRQRRSRPLTALLVAVALQLMVGMSPAFAFPDGILDTTFNSTGKATLDLGGSDEAKDVVIQPDGMTVVAGGRIGGPSGRISLARYAYNGSLDCTFGACGITALMVNGAWANSVALDTSGRIVVAGRWKGGSGADFIVARFKSNGSLDLGFYPPNGYVITNFGGVQDEAMDVAIQADGKIVVVGTGGPGTTQDIAVARYDTTGALDPTFGISGKVLTNPVGSNEVGNAVAIQPNGTIVVAGQTDGGSNGDGLVLRYKPTGQLDTNFGGTGFVTTSFGAGHDAFNDVVIDGGGRILAGGSSAFVNGDFAMARYATTGALDLNFNGTGKVTTDIGGANDALQSLSLVNSTYIMAIGATSASGGNFAVARYSLSGVLDPTFGPSSSPGLVTTDFGSGDAAFGAALDPLKCLLVAAGTTSSNWAVARYSLCHGMPM